MHVRCSAAVPRKSRPGPIAAQILPMARPTRSAAAFTLTGSMCAGSSIAISTVSKPHLENLAKSRVLSVVNGDVYRNVLMPILMEGSGGGRCAGGIFGQGSERSDFG